METLDSHQMNTITTLNKSSSSKISLSRELSQERINKNRSINHTDEKNDSKMGSSRNHHPVDSKYYSSISKTRSKHLRHSSIDGSYLSQPRSSYLGQSRASKSPDSIKSSLTHNHSFLIFRIS